MRRIRENVWGNIKGYEGRAKVEDFGTDRQAAVLWLLAAPQPVKPEHIREEWSEGEDGYWIALRTGWKWAGDPVGAVHSIHEPTTEAAHGESVMICECRECIDAALAIVKSRKDQPKENLT